MNKLIIVAIIIFSGLISAQSVSVKNSSAAVLLEINDEGTDGSSLVLPSGLEPSSGTANKLYNVSGTLNWNGSPLGNGLWTLNTTDIYFNTGEVGIGTTTPQGLLDLTSTSGALIVPRMTGAQRDVLPTVNGSIIYNTDANQFNFFEGGSWVTK